MLRAQNRHRKREDVEAHRAVTRARVQTLRRKSRCPMPPRQNDGRQVSTCCIPAFASHTGWIDASVRRKLWCPLRALILHHLRPRCHKSRHQSLQRFSPRVRSQPLLRERMLDPKSQCPHSKKCSDPKNLPPRLGFSLGLDVKDDSGAGFSLLDSLGLDLELEEEPLDDTPPPTLAPIQTRYPASEVVHQQDEPKRLAPFFPSTAEAAWNGANAQAAVLRWMRPRTEEQRQDDWSRYKQSLTPAVKKRHREAARKHKRNFKSLPHQQPNIEANPTARRV
ncbi:hypothetical protein L1887_56591 [Cichorium endivia]|nr:hypothetical protein L1887_56591 [Cichorium endivia]